jgi:hypothetical protein
MFGFKVCIYCHIKTYSGILIIALFENQLTPNPAAFKCIVSDRILNSTCNSTNGSFNNHNIAYKTGERVILLSREWCCFTFSRLFTTFTISSSDLSLMAAITTQRTKAF